MIEFQLKVNNVTKQETFINFSVSLSLLQCRDKTQVLTHGRQVLYH
jgi:hypothetical protein